MKRDPYRHLPIVQERAEVSSCRACKHEWVFYADWVHTGCSLTGNNEPWLGCWEDWRAQAQAGKCPRYEARAWVRLLQFLGLRKRHWRTVQL